MPNVDITLNYITTGDDKAKKSAKGLTESYTELKSQLDLLGMGFSAVTKIYDEIIGGYNEQAQAVRELALATGTGADETSRMIQVFDDAGINTDKLRGAMIAMKNNGIAPTIDNIAKLSDEYRAIQDPTEKVEFLTKKLGARGIEVAKAFEMTGDEIRTAAASVDDSLIFDEEKIAKAEQLRMAEDTLRDTFTGLKNDIANFIIPGFAAATTSVAGYTAAVVESIQENGMLESSWIVITTGVSAVYDELTGRTVPALEETTVAVEDTTAANENLYVAQDDVSAQMSTQYYAAIYAVEGAMRANEQAAMDLEAANATMFESLNTNILSTVQSVLEKIDFMNNGGLTLMQTFDDAYAALLKDPGDPAAQQRIKEMEAAALALQVNIGEIDASVAAQNIADTLGISLSDAYIVLQDLRNDLAKGAELTVDVNYNDPGWGGGGPSKNESGKGAGDKYEQNAMGGDVYSGVPSRVGESGPEIFVPSSDGRIVSNADAMRAIKQQTTIINLSVNSQQSLGSINQDVGLMKARAKAY